MTRQSDTGSSFYVSYVFASSLWKKKGSSKTKVMYAFWSYTTSMETSPHIGYAHGNWLEHLHVEPHPSQGCANGSKETGKLDLVGNKLTPVNSTSSEGTLRLTDHAGVFFSLERWSSPLDTFGPKLSLVNTRSCFDKDRTWQRLNTQSDLGETR